MGKEKPLECELGGGVEVHLLLAKEFLFDEDSGAKRDGPYIS